MLKRIKRVSALQLGKVMAFIYGLLMFLFIPIMLIGYFTDENFGMSLIFILLMPILYAAISFVMGVIMAWIYNLSVKWVGGVEIELEDKVTQVVESTQNT